MHEQVAGFGVLPSLRCLTLFMIDKLVCLGKELYFSAAAAGGSTTTIAFPSLKKLSLKFMSSLEEWVVPPPGATCFPLLEEIKIMQCPDLTTITPVTTIFPSLKVLDLHRMDGRAAKPLVTNNLNSLTSVKLYHIPNLISLPCQGLLENNNTLLSLEIDCCEEFKGFLPPNMDEDDEEEEEERQDNDADQGGGGQQLHISQVTCSSSLQSLTFYDCPVLRFFPDIRSLTSLRKLEIQDCQEFRSLQDELTCLSSSLEHLEHVKILNNNTATAKEEIVFEWRKKSSSFKE